jgi:diguanylate cyclase (GGDEF)-like protein/PAS domain S-box-containing protein
MFTNGETPTEVKREECGEMNEIKEWKTSHEIVARSIDAIFVLDSESNITFINSALEELSGFTFLELKQKPLHFLFPFELTKGKSLTVGHYLVSDEARYVSGSGKELELNSKSSGVIPVEMRVFEISPAGEGNKQYAAIIRDIRERKRLEDQRTLLINSLKRLAYMDELTLLPNRRSFYDSLTKSIAIVKRRNREAILGAIDIDHFKEINDTYGHDIGDLVLKSIATIFTDCLREEDTIGRVGGEEFGCILPDTNLEGATIVFDRMLETVRSHRFFVFDNFYLNVTISMGFTRIHPSQKADEVSKLADIALYQAKSSGRDRIQSYPI